MDPSSRSRERFATVFQLCPVGLALTSEQGLIIEANPALARLLGRTEPELVGRRLLEFTHPEDRAPSASAGSTVLAGDRAEAVLDKRYLRPDGTAVPVRVTMIAFDDPHENGGAEQPRKLTQVEDLSERRAAEDNLRREAHEDPLTGLVNRRGLRRELQPLLEDAGTGEAASRASEPAPTSLPISWAVVFVDLDDFKTVNDAHGHSVGDQVLVAVARRLAGVTRDGDVVARVGGDEFVVLLHVEDESDVERAQARIRRSLERPVRVADRRLQVTASVGGTLPRPDDSAEGLLERADAAMYREKSRGRE